MEQYENLSWQSNIRQYKIGEDYIIVKFSDDSCYKYTYLRTGRSNVESMKVLARCGQGLSSFINKEVRYEYDSKW